MLGIAGIILFDSTPLLSAEIDRMIRAMAI